MSIPRLSLNKLTHHQMMEFGYELISAMDTVTYAPIEDIKKDFASKVKNFDLALKYPIRSVLTPRIQEANKKRNRAWSKLLSAVKNHLNDDDRNSASVAENAYLILQTYGSPTKVDRKEKSGIIRNLLDDFKTKLEPGDDELIHIDKWLKELDEWNTEYILLFTTRRDQQATYPKGAGATTRIECEKAYRQLREWLNVEDRKPDNDKKAALQTLINNINKVIADYCTLINQRAAQAKARKKTEPESPSEPESKPNPESESEIT